MSKFENDLGTHISKYYKNTYYDKKRHFIGLLIDSFPIPSEIIISKIPIYLQFSKGVGV